MTVRKTIWGSGAGMGLGDKKEEGVRGRSQGSDLYKWLDGCSFKGTSWKRPAVKGGDQHPRSPLHDSQAHRGEAWPSRGPVSHHGGCVAGACPAPPETSPTTARRTHVKIFSPVQSSLSSLIFVLRSRLWAASPILTARLLWLAGCKDAFPSSPGSEGGGDVKEGNSLGNTRTYTLCHTHTHTRVHHSVSQDLLTRRCLIHSVKLGDHYIYPNLEEGRLSIYAENGTHLC